MLRSCVRAVRANIVSLSAALVLLLFPSLLRGDVLKIRIDATINPITDEYIQRAITEAEKIKADALLIELSTPGGLSTSTREIIEKIVASKTPVIIYVTPSGSRAASAGFFILESADIAAMAPGTNTGAAAAVTMMGGDIPQTMKEKVENDSAALMRSITSKRGRNTEAAESAVRQAKSFTDQEALDQHLIEVIAKDQQDLFKQLEGHTVKRFNGSQTVLHLADKTVRNFDMTLKQHILGYMMDPNVSFIILAIGLLALYFEFNHPGAIVPGVVGLIFIILAAFAFNLMPTRYAALALILLSFALFALEAKYGTHGVLTVAGIVTMTIGALLLVDTPVPEMRVRLATALAVSVPIGLITAFLLSIAVRARRNKVMTGTQGLVGQIGVARTPLTPEGKVFIHGELWNAVGSAEMAAGDEVTVRRVDGLMLYVEPTKVRQSTPQPTNR